MAFYRGQDGSIALSSVAVANVKSWTLSVTQEILDTTVMSIQWKTALTGLASWTGSAVLNLDVGDASQATILEDLIQATPGGTAFALKFRINGTTKYIGGNGLMSSAAFSEALSQIVTVTMNFTGTGALSALSGTWT